MQRQTAIVVVVLVTITLLFFMGVGAGLLQGERKGSSQGDAARHGQQGWVAWMGGLLAPFGPRVDLDRLQCANQPLSRPFWLDRDGQGCSFTIGAADSERPRQATLQVNPSQAAVYVLSEGKPPGRDPACVPRSAELRGPLVLQVEYTPRGAEALEQPCWLPVQPTEKRSGSGRTRVLEVRFAVLKDGGTVALTCKGCSGEHRIELGFVR